MLALFFVLGRFLGEFASFAAFVVALARFLSVCGRSGLDFRGFREGLGRVLEPPSTYFSMFCRA